MDSDNKHLIVGGIQFQTEEEARDARLEIRQIKYLKTKINFENKEHVKKAYDKLLESQTFKTVIGKRFMDELQKFASGEKTATAETAVVNTLPPPIDSTSARRKRDLVLPENTQKAVAPPNLQTIQATDLSTPKGPKPSLKTMLRNAFSAYNPEAPFHLAVTLNVLQLIAIIVLIIFLAAAYGKLNEKDSADSVSNLPPQVQICYEIREDR